jgi:hypothetical protein
MNSSKPELGVLLTKAFPGTVLGVGIGEKAAGTAGAGAVVGLWSKKLGGPSTTGRFISGL